MAKAISEKCRQCSKLSAQDAQQKECWNPKLCHQRRYNYRKRGSRVKEQREARKAKRLPQVIDPPSIYTLAAIAIFYRRTKESPVHAIAAELTENGKTISSIDPVHCLGVTEAEAIRWFKEALKCFSREYGREINRYVEQTTEYQPSECPICKEIGANCG